MNTGRALYMAVRKVDMTGRLITGLAVPYDSTSYLTDYGDQGERVLRGAFNKSIRQRDRKILLFRNHNHDRAVGVSNRFANTDAGLESEFYVPPSTTGDEVLAEVEAGLLPGLSVGYKPIRQRAGADGVMEVQEGQLLEVSLVTIPAYDGTGVAVRRHAPTTEAWWARPLPTVDLSPVRPL